MAVVISVVISYIIYLPEKDVASISTGKEPRRCARNESIDWPVDSNTSGPPELLRFIDFLRRLRLPGRLPSEPLLSAITPPNRKFYTNCHRPMTSAVKQHNNIEIIVSLRIWDFGFFFLEEGWKRMVLVFSSEIIFYNPYNISQDKFDKPDFLKIYYTYLLNYYSNILQNYINIYYMFLIFNNLWGTYL